MNISVDTAHPVLLTCITNPIYPRQGRQIQWVDWVPTVQECIRSQYPAVDLSDIQVAKNGNPCSIEDKVVPGDNIAFFIMPHGGGEGNKVLRTIAMIALVIATRNIGFAFQIGGAVEAGTGAVAGGFTVSSSMVAAGVFWGGTMLINAVLPPSIDKPRGEVGLDESSTYGWDVQRNPQRDGAASPVVYGDVVVAPPLISWFTYDLYEESAAATDLVDNQVLCMQFWLAEGYIDNVSDITINDLSFGDLAEVASEYNRGTEFSQWALDQACKKTIFYGGYDISEKFEAFGSIIHENSIDYEVKFTDDSVLGTYSPNISLILGILTEITINNASTNRLELTLTFSEGLFRWVEIKDRDGQVTGYRVTSGSYMIEFIVYDSSDVEVTRKTYISDRIKTYSSFNHYFTINDIPDNGSVKARIIAYPVDVDGHEAPAYPSVSEQEEWDVSVSFPIFRTNSNYLDHVTWRFKFPYGLYYVANDGSLNDESVDLVVHYREVGTSNWSSESKTVTGSSRSDQVVTIEKDLGSIYSGVEFYVSFSSDPGSTTKDMNECWLVAVVERLTDEGPVHRGIAKANIYKRADSLVSGGLPLVKFALSRKQVYVYTGEATDSYAVKNLQHDVALGPLTEYGSRIDVWTESKLYVKLYWNKDLDSCTFYVKIWNKNYIDGTVVTLGSYDGNEEDNIEFTIYPTEMTGRNTICIYSSSMDDLGDVSINEVYGYQYLAKDADNPAWVAYDMINREYGADKGAAEIDTDAFEDWADWCDFPDTESGAEPALLRCNLYYDALSDFGTALSYVCRLGRANVIQQGNLWTVIVDRDAEVVQMFNTNDIIEDSLEIYYLSKKDRANVIEVTYNDRDLDSKRQTLTRYSSDYVAGTTTKNKLAINLYGCDNRDLAVEHADYLLRGNAKLIREVSFEVFIRAIACQVGDVIYVQSFFTFWGEGARVDSVDNVLRITFDRDITSEAAGGFTYLLDADGKYVLDADGKYLVFKNGDSLLLSCQDITDDSIYDFDVTDYGEDWVEVASWGDYSPAADDYAILGVSGEVRQKFRVTDITRSAEHQRKITALEYDESIYTIT